jgi:hypothetical protein
VAPEFLPTRGSGTCHPQNNSTSESPEAPFRSIDHPSGPQCIFLKHIKASFEAIDWTGYPLTGMDEKPRRASARDRLAARISTEGVLGWYEKKLRSSPRRRRGEVHDPSIADPRIFSLIVDGCCKSICRLTISHAALNRGQGMWVAAGVVVSGLGGQAEVWRAGERLSLLTDGVSVPTDYVTYHVKGEFLDPKGAVETAMTMDPALSPWVNESRY